MTTTPTRYLLACPNCPERIVVSAAQAGQDVTCPACRGATKAPRLGQLLRLPPVDEPAPPATTSPRKEKSTPAAGRRWTFAIGLVLLIIGLAVGIRCYYMTLSIPTEIPAEMLEMNSAVAAHLETLPPDAMMQSWIDFRQAEPTEWREHAVWENRRRVKALRLLAGGGMGVAALGLAALVASALMRK